MSMETAEANSFENWAEENDMGEMPFDEARQLFCDEGGE